MGSWLIVFHRLCGPPISCHCVVLCINVQGFLLYGRSKVPAVRQSTIEFPIQMSPIVIDNTAALGLLGVLALMFIDLLGNLVVVDPAASAKLYHSSCSHYD